MYALAWLGVVTSTRNGQTSSAIKRDRYGGSFFGDWKMREYIDVRRVSSSERLLHSMISEVALARKTLSGDPPRRMSNAHPRGRALLASNAAKSRNACARTRVWVL